MLFVRWKRTVNLKLFSRLLLATIASLRLVAGAQTINITNGVQKYASLASTTVNMSGRCELWVTNSSTPLSGCTINLNSTEAWLFLPGVKPSVVASNYLGQLKANGAAAVAGSNVQVVQYGQSGAIVIPQASSFQPLTVFTGREFTGTAAQRSQWTYYKGSGNTNISSFKLTRGYQVVFAQSANGVSWSQCYTAQDGDLEVGVLPATLDKQVQFIYVTPWRWTSKKGIAGNPGISWLNVLWWYDWNIDQSSTSDLEYLAIEQDQYWPSLSQNWQSLGINTLLGYNEPDQANQANLSVSQAISSWGNLLGTGLRVGSPATSDGGPNTWLIPFVSQAAAAGLRVDFVCTHYYQANDPSNPSACASQMYNFLLNIWNNTRRPIWVTEWNNGANWTDNNPYPPPTYAQQQACIAAMVNMLETTPFVERYALYNWVEDTRSLVTSSNTVTPAGTAYSNTVSALSYSQAMPDNGTRGIGEFLFATNLWDTSGCYNNGMAIGAPAYTTGHNSQARAVVLDGANSYIQLPANIAEGGAFTFAGWVYWNGGTAWQRIFDFGNDTSHYLFLTPDSGSGTLRFAINNGDGEQIVERAGALASGSWQHVAITLGGGTAILYVNGAQVASATGFTNTPSSFNPIKNYLGKSQFAADPLFGGKFDEVEVADYALSAAQISALYSSALAPLYTGGVWTNDASGNWGVSNNWSNGLIANGAGFIADFSTLNITANRTVTLDGARSIGGLKFGDTSGAQNWVLNGGDTLTLDGGSTNVPTIAVNQNTATISAPLSGGNGLAKNGNGTLALSGTNTLGGSLYVDAGAVNLTGGSLTFTGSGASSIGYENSTGVMNLNGTFAALGNVWVGGSDQSGSGYSAIGTLNISGGAAYFGGSAAYGGPHFADGSLAIGAGNNYQNSCSGTVTVSSGTVWCTNDLIVGFAGMGTGTLNIDGNGAVNVGPVATKWLSIGKWDTCNGIINIGGGNLNLMNNTAIKFSSGNGGNNGGGGTNAITQSGGAITFYSDGGATVGGSGYLDLSQSGSATANNTYNLNGGTLIVPQIISETANGTRTFNFNGGTLKAAAANANFMSLGADSGAIANVRNGGAIIDDGGFSISVAQALVHSTIPGDSATDGGLTKNGSGTLTLTGVNTYTGNTTINAGALELAQATLTPNSVVTIAGGAKVQLDFATTNSIRALVLNGVVQPAGIYNSNTAANFITGTGSFQVTSLTNAINIAFTTNAGALALSWPGDHVGWRLLMQTNNLNLGLSLNTNDWMTVPNSSVTNQLTITLNPLLPAEFYQLVYP